LCGFPPFYGDDDEAFDQIIEGEFDYPEPYWDHISDSAKDLINHLLVVDPTQRYDTRQSLQHPWVVGANSSTHLSHAQEQLKKFLAQKRWKKAINTTLAVNKLQKLKLNRKEKKKFPKTKTQKN